MPLVKSIIRNILHMEVVCIRTASYRICVHGLVELLHTWRSVLIINDNNTHLTSQNWRPDHNWWVSFEE